MKKNKLYVVGNPIKHSKSPLIHNFWIKKYSINATYNKLKVTHEEIFGLINDLKADRIHGLNVTIPYKQIMLNFVDEIEPSALKSKAINTVYKIGKKIVGANTDGFGFISSLKNDLNYKIKKNSNILCIGSGGAAYGIISSLLEYKPRLIEIINRTESSGLDLVRHFKKYSADKILISRPWRYNPCKSINLLINTSACGMEKNDKFEIDLGSLSKDVLVYDIIYNPRKTTLMKQAEVKGLRNTNGIFMLIRQAAESFNKWFGIKLNDSDIEEAIKILGDKL